MHSFLHKDWSIWLRIKQQYNEEHCYEVEPLGFTCIFFKKQVMVVCVQHAIHSICQAFPQKPTTSSTIWLALNIKVFSMRLTAVQSYKGAQHLFERNTKLCSRRLANDKLFFEELKECMEGVQHCFRIESFEYQCFMIMVFLTESVGKVPVSCSAHDIWLWVLAWASLMAEATYGFEHHRSKLCHARDKNAAASNVHSVVFCQLFCIGFTIRA